MPIDEQQYPIRGAYFAKMWVIVFIFLIIAGGFVIIGMQPSQNRVICTARTCQNAGITMYALAGFAIFFAIILMLNILSIKVNFHYMFDDRMITVKQGLFSREEKYMPYEVIQNVFVSQGPLDKLFGVASLKVQNAAAAAAGATANPGFRLIGGPSRSQENVAQAVVNKNSIAIPGLLKQDAETLRDMVLQKTQEHPSVDTNIGL